MVIDLSLQMIVQPITMAKIVSPSSKEIIMSSHAVPFFGAENYSMRESSWLGFLSTCYEDGAKGFSIAIR